MAEQEVGAHLASPESTAPAERHAVHAECQEACTQLEREVCLNRLITDLDIQCTEEARQRLIPALIQKESTLPKRLNDLPVPIAKAQILKLLPKIEEAATQKTLATRQEEQSNLSHKVKHKEQQSKENANTIEQKSNTVSLKERLAAEKERLLTSKPDLRGQALIEALSQTALVKKAPELQTLLVGFAKILSLSQNQQDQAVLEAKISRIDFASFPDPVLFIQSEIIDSPDISLATQQSIARAFRITPYKVVTGSDVQRAFTERIIDPESGEERPRFNEAAPLEYRPGVSAFNGRAGEQFVQFKFDNQSSAKFDVTGWNENDVAALSEYGAISKGFNDAGVSHFMEHAFHLPNAFAPQFDPLKAIESRQIVETLLGFNEGYDGKIYGADRSAYFKWFVQMLSPKGDWAQGDFDIHASQQALQGLGIRSKEGDINLDVLHAVGSHARGIYGTGAPDYEALQNHLHTLYGGRIPLSENIPQ